MNGTATILPHTQRYQEFGNTQIKNSVSRETESLLRQLIPAKNKTYIKTKPLEEVLFDARSNAKIKFSTLSMHFTNELKEKLFNQLDLIHDTDEWEEEEKPIREESLLTFLRWFHITSPTKYPNFGLSNDGSLIASWIAGDAQSKLILEFGNRDSINWFVEKHYEDSADLSRGKTKLLRVNDMISPYKPEIWFNK